MHFWIFVVKYSILAKQECAEHEKYDMKSLFCVIFPLFFGDFAHFLHVEGNGKEGKVHFNLVHSKVAKSFISHVVFHLTEDRLWLNASSPSVFYPLFGKKSFTSLFPVPFHPVVNVDRPVPLAIEAASPERAPLAALRLVAH